MASKEARDAAIKKASESVRDGSGWVRSAQTAVTTSRANNDNKETT